jgi:hypothetical protein
MADWLRVGSGVAADVSKRVADITAPEERPYKLRRVYLAWPPSTEECGLAVS